MPASQGISLVVVRNTVSHDARVLRTAATMRAEGFKPLVVGVMSTQERTGCDEIAGVDVLRLDPRSPMARVRRRIRSAQSTAPSGAPIAPNREPVRIPGPLVALHRL